MSIESENDLIGMRKASEAVAITLKRMSAYAKPGMSTYELDQYGAAILASFGARSAPKLVYKFPGCACICVNHEAAHGIPSKKRILQEGDLINIDVSAELNGFFSDNGGSFVLGHDLQALNPLVQASKEILHKAIYQIKGGVKINEIGRLIDEEAKKRGFKVIKNLCGHGIGRKLHEAPSHVANYHDRTNLSRFKKNSVVAIETFISTKAHYTTADEDGWTEMTSGFVAQHEHTIVVTDKEPIILTHENEIWN
ncbi:MAG: type I methionyl aminopeptidase [Janthinobacterium lividum]